MGGQGLEDIPLVVELPECRFVAFVSRDCVACCLFSESSPLVNLAPKNGKWRPTKEKPENVKPTQTRTEHGPNGQNINQMVRTIPRATPTWTSSRHLGGKTQETDRSRTGIG